MRFRSSDGALHISPVGMLACGKVRIKFLFTFKDRHSREGLDNRKYFQDLWLHAYKRCLAPSAFDYPPGVGKYSKTRTADEFEICQVEDQVANGSRED